MKKTVNGKFYIQKSDVLFSIDHTAHKKIGKLPYFIDILLKNINCFEYNDYILVCDEKSIDFFNSKSYIMDYDDIVNMDENELFIYYYDIDLRIRDMKKDINDKLKDNLTTCNIIDLYSDYYELSYMIMKLDEFLEEIRGRNKNESKSK